MANPSVEVRLADDGGLELLLPGPMGRDRAIKLRDRYNEQGELVLNPLSIIRMVLVGLTEGKRNIGSQGAPTRAQVKHWTVHGKTKDSRCPFCRLEGHRAPISFVAVGLSGKTALGRERAKETRKRNQALRDRASPRASTDLGF